MTVKADSAGATGGAGGAPARHDRRGRARRAAQALVWLATGLGAAASAAQPASSAGPAAVRPHVPMPAPSAVRKPADADGRVSVWVDLELPELASVPRGRRAEREALRSQIQAQQDAVMGRLRELGATEQARVQQVRNALAVRLPVAQLDAARRIPSVRAVRIVRNIDRDPLVQGN